MQKIAGHPVGERDPGGFSAAASARAVTRVPRPGRESENFRPGRERPRAGFVRAAQHDPRVIRPRGTRVARVHVEDVEHVAEVEPDGFHANVDQRRITVRGDARVRASRAGGDARPRRGSQIRQRAARLRRESHLPASADGDAGANRTPPIVAAPCGPVHASGTTTATASVGGYLGPLSGAFACFADIVSAGSFARERTPGAARADSSRTSKRDSARSAAAARSTPRTGGATDGRTTPDPTVRSVPETTRAEMDVVVSAEASRIRAVAAEVARPADGDDFPGTGDSPADAQPADAATRTPVRDG